MREALEGRRVAVTGLGVVSPYGIGAEAFWQGLFTPPANRTERRIPDWDPTPWLDRTAARRLDRFAQFAVAAAAGALTDAGIDGFTDGAPYDEERVGVVVGTGIGGADSWERQVLVLPEKGPRRVSPLTIPLVMPNSAAATISMRWGLRGPCETIATACATGTHSIAAGARLVASGRSDAVLAGGAEATMTPTNIAAFTNMQALSPSGVSRPFDVRRDGFCVSEGAAVVVLEELALARTRGAPVYAEITGAASNADAFHVTAPRPGGAGAAACMRLALADAGLAPADVRQVNAHGTSTPLNDPAEAAAIEAVFGLPGPPVTSIKGVTGHSLGAAGALEAVSVALSFRHACIPPTMGTEQVDPDVHVDLVTSPRTWQPGPTISNSFAFGGHNGCLVLVPV